MRTLRRYAKLYLAFVRCTLARELSFRGNFLMRAAVEFLWFCLLVLFYDIIYGQTAHVGGWTQFQYMVLIGTFFLVTGLIDTLVMPNCAELAEQVRTGNLDHALVKPVDEQFILTLPRLDWANASNLLYGGGMVAYSLFRLEHWPTAAEVAAYCWGIFCAFVFFYSVLSMLAISAVYLVRNQSIWEQWFYVNLFARYPPEIFTGTWAKPLRTVLTYVFPVLVVVSVPARVLAHRVISVQGLLIATVAAGAAFALSRFVFRRVLLAYRGASA